ncbi:ThuA domain-containing protein [Phenylobacterium sp. LjRoot219]|uniref:ThuA domain-containing protein n=1 Tax=Phenylobacterium sp. LjRoot219 TaxID=3342283 RepID=UPI003ECFD5DC
MSIAARGFKAAAAVGLFALACLTAAPAAAAQPDCPAAFAPYSSDTVLLDLLLDPRAAAVLEQQGMLKGLPSMLRSAQPPTLAAVMSPRWMMSSAFAGADAAASAAKLQALDAALGQIPITAEAAQRRCARYDQAPPTLPKPERRPAILVFEKINGYRDEPSVNAAHKALTDMAARRGWSIAFTDNGAAFNAAQLRTYDAVVWNNVSGDALTLPQQKAFQAYLADGGGFAGIHGSAGDFTYVWPWYRDVLIGATFIGHTLNPQFRAAKVVVADPKSGIAAKLPDSWTMTEEWYSFAGPPAPGARILVRLDESTYAPGPRLAMGDHPLAWTRCLGEGRSFYTAIGHRPESYVEPNSVELLEQGIAWAARQGDTRCAKGREVSAQAPVRAAAAR